MQVGSLGDIIFETSATKILTLNDFSREHSARFASHEVQGAAPRLEFLSRELSSSSFTLRFCSSFGTNPLEEMEKLKALCHDGKVVKLIIAGQNLGDVIVEKVSEAWKHTAPNGQGPFIIDASVSIKEYL